MFPVIRYELYQSVTSDQRFDKRVYPTVGRIYGQQEMINNPGGRSIIIPAKG